MSSFSSKFHFRKVNMFAKGGKVKKKKEKKEQDRHFFHTSSAHCAFGLPPVLHHSAASKSAEKPFQPVSSHVHVTSRSHGGTSL